MKTPTNTTEQVTLNPRSFLIEAMVVGTSHAIEAQESRGQTELVNSETLPSEIDAAGKAALEAAGVAFGAKVDGDPMFTHVTLPAGWKKARTNHSMWSDLLDANGCKRAAIFYKAAFYDRSAHMHAERRYRVGLANHYDSAKHVYAVIDGWTAGQGETPEPDSILFRGDEFDARDWNRSSTERERMAAWLTENRPQWQDAAAYWDAK